MAGPRFIGSVSAAALVCGLVAGVTAEAPAAATTAVAPRTTVGSPPKPDPSLKPDGVSDNALQDVIERVEKDKSIPDLDTVRVKGERIRVEIGTREGEDARAVVNQHGGTVLTTIGSNLLVADVPADELESLERASAVTFVRLPLQASAPVGQVTSSGANIDLRTSGQRGKDAVQKSRAGAWQAIGYTGRGVRIGIIDSFSPVAWNSASAAGELPRGPNGTFCRNNGAACNIWATHEKHGVAVAEVVKDIAPKAQIFIASTTTAYDMKLAVDYFRSQGVRIITRSLTGFYDGPGNGTGPTADVMAYAVANGMTWFNSAGNSAGNRSNPGSYWRSYWHDPDGDNWLNFPDGTELMAFDCSFLNGLRWSDWGANRTDYDAYVFDKPSSTSPEGWGTAGQQGGAPPIESPTCHGTNDIDYLKIYKYANGSGTAGDVLEFMTNGYAIEFPTNAYSATGPAADTRKSGTASVGAVDPVFGHKIAIYSSRGPTNDRRTKPDLSAASNMTSHTYGRFSGTSAATPLVAGAAALVLQAYPRTSPAQLVTYLKSSAVSERGPRGADNTYGSGELTLPGGRGPKVTALTGRVRPGSVVSSRRTKMTLSWRSRSYTGVSVYALWRRTNSGAWKRISTTTRRSKTVSLAKGSRYRFAVAARDRGGVWSGYRYSPTFRTRLVNDRKRSVTYSAHWRRYRDPHAYRHTVTRTERGRAAAKFGFKGSGVAWVATKRPSGGKARVYIDGRYRRTVDLHARTKQHKRVLASFGWSSHRRHTIKVVGHRLNKRRWVDVDAFVVVR